MTVRMKVEGLRELEASLIALGNATAAKSVGRKVLRKAGKPIADAAKSLAPDDPNTSKDLKASIDIGTKLNKRQRKFARKETKSHVEIHVGTSDPAGIQQEFGNVNHGPQPFMRPAWAANKFKALKIIKTELSGEIVKAAKRLAAKAARGK
ncbi:MAG TPA: hypothetical protein DCG72_03715 [Gammaproteobacteria bacterium]|nr:hypothetical protein [Gammaproteobacteria bacterium]